MFVKLNADNIMYWLTWLNIACWVVCFWWMHRISTRQDSFLSNLKAQGLRIEKLSKAEHDLIKEVHPQVSELVENMHQVVDSVRDTPDNQISEKPK